MNTYLVTPASEAEDQLLAALFEKMRVKAQAVPKEDDKKPVAKRPAKQAAPATTLPLAS